MHHVIDQIIEPKWLIPSVSLFNLKESEFLLYIDKSEVEYSELSEFGGHRKP